MVELRGQALSDAYHATQDPRELDTIDTSIQWKAEALGWEAPEMAASYEFKSNYFLQREDWACARRWIRKGLRVRSRAYGPRHPSLATSYRYLGYLEQRQGRNSKAEKLYLDALELVAGSSTREESDTLLFLALLYQEMGLPEKASLYSQRAKDAMARESPPLP